METRNILIILAVIAGIVLLTIFVGQADAPQVANNGDQQNGAKVHLLSG